MRAHAKVGSKSISSNGPQNKAPTFVLQSNMQKYGSKTWPQLQQQTAQHPKSCGTRQSEGKIHLDLVLLHAATVVVFYPAPSSRPEVLALRPCHRNCARMGVPEKGADAKAHQRRDRQLGLFLCCLAVRATKIQRAGELEAATYKARIGRTPPPTTTAESRSRPHLAESPSCSQPPVGGAAGYPNRHLPPCKCTSRGAPASRPKPHPRPAPT